MRRVLVESARARGRVKRGGRRHRVDLRDAAAAAGSDPDLLLSLDEALTRLAAEDAGAAEVASLHQFAGLSVEEAAAARGVSRAAAYRDWAYARAWIHPELKKAETAAGG
jgi:RNA polymerase sigma factor (TIGR02999 family)